MKTLLRVLAVLLVLSAAFLFVSCDSLANAAGIYTGEFTMELKMEGGNGHVVRTTQDIRAELVLDAAGRYTFSTWHNSDITNITYSEAGSFILDGEVITFVPDEAMFMVKGGDYEMRTLTAEEQASMISTGTYKEDSVTATMRWLYPYHSVAGEMQLARTGE